MNDIWMKQQSFQHTSKLSFQHTGGSCSVSFDSDIRCAAVQTPSASCFENMRDAGSQPATLGRTKTQTLEFEDGNQRNAEIGWPSVLTRLWGSQEPWSSPSKPHLGSLTIAPSSFVCSGRQFVVKTSETAEPYFVLLPWLGRFSFKVHLLVFVP